MNLLRKILFPFAILYGFITSIRNFLFDQGILKSYEFDFPIIAVGNLSAFVPSWQNNLNLCLNLIESKNENKRNPFRTRRNGTTRLC